MTSSPSLERPHVAERNIDRAYLEAGAGSLGE